ncbi:hypothetical protein ACJ41O_005482 [Fusarium nematophilum]
MPPKKRAYVPKTKGCHECSKRRIHCDRTEPSCNKCASRGLKCSGLGIRHRFNKGVAARGKWAGKTIESVYEECWTFPSEDQNAAVSSTTTALKPVQPEATETSRELETEQQDDEAIEIILQDLEVEDCFPGDLALLDDHTIFCSLFLQDIQENTPAWKRHLLLHFSQYISTEMVAIDGVHNDWRHLLLPLAQTDELVMDAVLTVSAFHFHINKLADKLHTDSQQYSSFGIPDTGDYYVPDPYQLCGRTLKGLRQRQELLNGDQTMKHSVLVTILLLLTAVLVTGGSDFPSFTIRVYAAPHLAEETGLEMISSQARTAQILGCLNHCIQQYPEHASVFSQVADLVYQARNIYLQQVLSDQTSGFFTLLEPEPAPPSPSSVSRVQRFIETLETIPQSSPVDHMLIWTTFVAASDCQLEEHKAFFEGVFRRHHARSGFGNLLKGIESLRRIWSRRPGERWTLLLPQTKVLVA